MGQAGIKLYTITETMLDRIADGDALIAYSVFDALGVILSTDYTLLTSRIAFILKQACHPAAARSFMDYMLSRDGQTRLAARSITPPRQDARHAADPVAHVPRFARSKSDRDC